MPDYNYLEEGLFDLDDKVIVDCECGEIPVIETSKIIAGLKATVRIRCPHCGTRISRSTINIDPVGLQTCCDNAIDAWNQYMAGDMDSPYPPEWLR